MKGQLNRLVHEERHENQKTGQRSHQPDSNLQRSREDDQMSDPVTSGLLQLFHTFSKIQIFVFQFQNSDLFRAGQFDPIQQRLVPSTNQSMFHQLNQ